ncbi:MAG TPA: hypothetical protein VNJ04_03795 [Gemmatimonadaceae bacterium]|nr:hypothetical protein [Gemmatimonadaceae bacterium]
MRIEPRMSKVRVDERLEPRRDVVFEHFGLGVDLVPSHAERVDQEHLDKPVVAYDLKRNHAASIGELGAAVQLVLHKPQVVQALEHIGDRGG